MKDNPVVWCHGDFLLKKITSADTQFCFQCILEYRRKIDSTFHGFIIEPFRN